MILVVKNNITNRIKISKRMRESYTLTHTHTTKQDAMIGNHVTDGEPFWNGSK